MDEEDFEGTRILEKLAENGKVDAFFEAVDAGQFGKAESLMRRAGIDQETIAMAVAKMRAGDE